MVLTATHDAIHLNKNCMAVKPIQRMCGLFIFYIVILSTLYIHEIRDTYTKFMSDIVLVHYALNSN